MIETIFQSLPLTINPIHSIVIVWLLAYLPHIIRKQYIKKKLAEKGMAYKVKDSRLLTATTSDSSVEGRRIAQLTGCHQNGLEAFTLFSISIGTCLITEVDLVTLSGAAFAFVVIRVIYTAIYLSTFNGPFRTGACVAGVVNCIAMLLIAADKLNIPMLSSYLIS